MFGKLDGRVGIFPADYVEPMSRIEARKISASSSRHTNQQVRQILSSFVYFLSFFPHCPNPSSGYSIPATNHKETAMNNSMTDEWWIPTKCCLRDLFDNWKDRKSTKRTMHHLPNANEFRPD